MSAIQQMLLTYGAGAACDPYFDYVKFLLHLDGANGSTTYTDSSIYNRTVDGYLSPQISTTDPKFGTGSLALGNVGSGINSGIKVQQIAGDLQPGTQDFTYELWVKASPINAQGSFGHQTNVFSFALYLGNIAFYDHTTSTFILQVTAPDLSTTWNHVAVTRSGNTFRMFINGSLLTSGTSSTNMSIGSTTTIPTIEIGTFGGNTGLAGNVDEVRYTLGVARYTANFTPPTAAFPNIVCTSCDPYYNNVSLLLHMDGTNGSTTFTDNSPSPKTVIVNGNTQISTSVVKYGTGSGSFDGNQDWLTVPTSTAFDFSNGAFTVEYWMYGISIPDGAYAIVGVWTPGWIVYQTATTYFFYVGTGTEILNVSHTLPFNTWTHYAVTRSGDTWRLFVNGTQLGSATNSATIPDSSHALDIGINGTNERNDFYGYLDDLRITKGVARYTANFTPPTAAFPNVAC